MSWLTDVADTAVGRRFVLGVVRLVVVAVLSALGVDALNADPLGDGHPRAIACYGSSSSNPLPAE